MKAWAFALWGSVVYSTTSEGRWFTSAQLISSCGQRPNEQTMVEYTSTPIAIIGIGCRLPGGVSNTESLWDLLAKGTTTWSPVPLERFNEDAFYHQTQKIIAPPTTAVVTFSAKMMTLRPLTLGFWVCPLLKPTRRILNDDFS